MHTVKLCSVVFGVTSRLHVIKQDSLMCGASSSVSCDKQTPPLNAEWRQLATVDNTRWSVILVQERTIFAARCYAGSVLYNDLVCSFDVLGSYDLVCRREVASSITAACCVANRWGVTETTLCKRGLCRHAVSACRVCPSVCTFVNSVKTNKRNYLLIFFTIG